MLRSAVLLLLLTAIWPALAATECQVRAPSAPRVHWTWRMVDGKRCWYVGNNWQAKALAWRVPVERIVAPERVPELPIIDDLPALHFDQRWAPLDSLPPAPTGVRR